MKDILGKALLDYYSGNADTDIITETNISKEDTLPLAYLFRNYSEMPLIEQKALELAKGRVLDVGCGSGIHSKYLQDQKHQVTSIDISRGAVEVTKLQGLKDVRHLELLNFKGEVYDTILLLMNGTGIFRRLELVSVYLNHLKSLLAPEGQILIDSSDIKYMYDTDKSGGIWVSSDRYYGQLEFTMSYSGEESETFEWLYLGPSIFRQACISANLTFEVILEGENFDYLARLRKNNS